MSESNKGSAVVSASLSKEQKEYIDEHDISPTQALKGKINEMREKGSPYKYTPVKFLNESRKMGLVLMLAGAAIFVIALGLWKYFLIALENVWPFVIVWSIGVLVSYYGYHEYSKWNDVIYWRSKLESKEE